MQVSLTVFLPTIISLSCVNVTVCVFVRQPPVRCTVCVPMFEIGGQYISSLVCLFVVLEVDVRSWTLSVCS